MTDKLTQPLKKEIDDYFSSHYEKLQVTATRLILRYNRHLDPSNVISWCYVYLVERQDEIVLHSKLTGADVLSILESFCVKYIKNSIVWNRSNVNRENDRLHDRTTGLEIFQDSGLDPSDTDNDSLDNSICLAESQQQDEIYTDEFITGFYESLSRLDAIPFRVYYYEGIDEAADFAAHFGISQSSAYATIKRMKSLLRQYIIKNQIY